MSIIVTLPFLFVSIDFDLNRDKEAGISDNDVNPSVVGSDILSVNIRVGEKQFICIIFL